MATRKQRSILTRLQTHLYIEHNHAEAYLNNRDQFQLRHILEDFTTITNSLDDSNSSPVTRFRNETSKKS